MNIILGIIISLVVVFSPLEIICPLLIFCFGLLISIFFQSKKDSKFLFTIFILAFLSRIGSSLLLYNLVFLHDGRGSLGDAWSYSESGYSILQMWLGGMRDIKEIASAMMKISTSDNLGSYDFWNAIVYYFTGKSPFSLIFINCLAGLFIVGLIYYTTKQLYNEKAAKISAILTAFWPSLFTWSIQNLKEPLSILLIAILIWAVVLLKTRFRFYLLFIIILASLALKELRMVSFFMFYAAILPVSLIVFLWKKNRVLFIFLLLLVGVGLTMVINNYFYHLSRSPLEYINYMRTVRAYGNTAFLSNLDSANLLKLILFTPVMILNAWLASFPWQVGSMSQIMAMPEMLLYYSLLPAMFLGWRFIIRHKIKEGGIIIIYIFIMMLVLAFIEGNIGTLFRHRAMVLPFMFILIGIGLEKINFRIIARN